MGGQAGGQQAAGAVQYSTAQYSCGPGRLFVMRVGECNACRGGRGGVGHGRLGVEVVCAWQGASRSPEDDLAEARPEGGLSAGKQPGLASTALRLKEHSFTGAGNQKAPVAGRPPQGRGRPAGQPAEQLKRRPAAAHNPSNQNSTQRTRKVAADAAVVFTRERVAGVERVVNLLCRQPGHEQGLGMSKAWARVSVLPCPRSRATVRAGLASFGTAGSTKVTQPFT